MTEDEILKIKEHIEIHARREPRAIKITEIMWKAVGELEHIAELEAYNEKLLNSDIEKHNKIVSLGMENAELKKRNKAVETTLELHSKFMKSKLTEAKNHIHRLLVLLTEGKRSYAVIDEARAFLQEESE